MEQKKQQINAILPFAFGVVIAVGVFQLIFGALMLSDEVAKLGTIEGSAGKIALFAVLMLLGLMEILSGVLGFRYRKNPGLHALCKRLGFALLIVSCSYVVSCIFLLGGMSFHYFFGVFIAVFYLAVIH